MSNETVILVRRETRQRLEWWLKLIFTLGTSYLRWRETYLKLTDRHLIYRQGTVLSANDRVIPLLRIQDITVKDDAAGRLAGYGDIVVETAGSSAPEVIFKHITRPRELREAILHQMSLQA